MSAKQHSSRSWDFPDSYAAFQHRDEQIDWDLEAYERSMMQDPAFQLACAIAYGNYQYDDPPITEKDLIEFEESCISGRGDLLHLAKAMIERKP